MTCETCLQPLHPNSQRLKLKQCRPCREREKLAYQQALGRFVGVFVAARLNEVRG